MIRTYKCSGCGSGMIYNAGTDSLICPKCSSTKKVKDVEAEIAAGNTMGTVGAEEAENSGSGVREFKCPNCGANLVTDDYTAASFCTFCSSPTLIESRVSGDFKPKKVLPFKFDKKQAQANFKAWAGKGLLTPPSFRSQAVMEKVTGVYVPYWLYTYKFNADVQAEGLKKHTEKSGNEETVTTEHFDVRRQADGIYEQVPKNASSKLDDSHMEVLEPFNYSEMVDFAMPYLSGYMAEKYEYTAEDLEEALKQVLEEDAVAAVMEGIEGYDSVEKKASQVMMQRKAADYAMLPVWTLNFKYGGKTYPLIMNGQTGKIDGELPTSRARVLALAAIAFVVIFLIAFLFGRVL